MRSIVRFRQFLCILLLGLCLTAASQVEHRLAGLQRGDGLRIVASETEVRAFGDCARLFHRVAQLLGYAPTELVISDEHWRDSSCAIMYQIHKRGAPSV